MLFNAELGATLAVLTRSDHTRALLLRERADGQPSVEDLGSALADAAGRGPLGGIEGLPIDLTQFESSGVIGVGDKSGSQPDDAGTDTISPGRVDIAALIQNDPAGAPEQFDQ